MRKALLAVMVSVAFMPAVIQAATIANNGTLTISGQINPAPVTTCDMAIAVGGGTTVTLAPVLLSAFTTVGSTTTPQTFTLNFTSCPSAMTDGMHAQLTLNGTADTNNANVFQNAQGTGNATGVAVQIQETNGAGSNMIPGTLNTENYTMASGAFNVPLQASIISTTGTPTAGTVSVTSTVQIDYQ